jgi:hypothetical protein
MKVCLAPRYRHWMWILLPTTLGVGTALLWMLSLGWPRAIETETLTLRGRRKIRWGEIIAIKLRCDYTDGRVTRIDVHHPRGRSRIAVNALLNGQDVATIILGSFKRARRARSARLALPTSDAPLRNSDAPHNVGGPRNSVPFDTRVRSSAA